MLKIHLISLLLRVYVKTVRFCISELTISNLFFDSFFITIYYDIRGKYPIKLYLIHFDELLVSNDIFK